MGNPKLRWTVEEEEALRRGVAKHGTGKWRNILVDLEFAQTLANRSNVDLKDKWRNMGVSSGQGCRTNAMTSIRKATVAVVVTPKTENSPSIYVSKDNVNNKPLHSPQDVENTPNYNAMILEALSSINDRNGSDFGGIKGFIENKYEVRQSFRSLLSSKLRTLVSEGTLEKVNKFYKIKHDALGTKTRTPKQKDVRSSPLQESPSTISDETVEDEAKTAADKIAEAENKAIVAAEAVKESERVSQMAEDADALLMRLKEIFEQCSPVEGILMM